MFKILINIIVVFVLCSCATSENINVFKFGTEEERVQVLGILLNEGKCVKPQYVHQVSPTEIEAKLVKTLEGGSCLQRMKIEKIEGKWVLKENKIVKR